MNRIFLTNDPAQINRVYGAELQEKLGCPEVVLDSMLGGSMPQVAYIFSTWGMPSLSEEEIRRCFPALKAVFYAAGSVQHFARPFLNCGVRVFSAWGANAVPVAEFCVAQILLANKGFFQSAARMQQREYWQARDYTNRFPGNFGAVVGLIGCGMIGSLTAQMLRGYRLEVLAYDPYLSDERAEALGVAKCGLEELFRRCDTISNHLPNNEQTRQMLGYGLFQQMKPNAAFINTGRGAQVEEAGLVRALEEEPGRTALLDVTEPEPPEPGSPLYRLPNVILTPHIAGSTGREVARMGEHMHEEYQRMLAGHAARYEVTAEMLETMA